MTLLNDELLELDSRASTDVTASDLSVGASNVPVPIVKEQSFLDFTRLGIHAIEADITTLVTTAVINRLVDDTPGNQHLHFRTYAGA